MEEAGCMSLKCSVSSGCCASEGMMLVQCRAKRVSFRNVLGTPAFRNLRRWKSLVGKNNRVFSMAARERARSMMVNSTKQKSIPVYVMMPADSIGVDDTSGVAVIREAKALRMSLKALKLAGVRGVTVEVWWGLVERSYPSSYNWALYEDLFKWIAGSGLKMHVAFCFHSKVRSSSSQPEGSITLPLWVLKVGSHDGDIYYKDRYGLSSDDYLTLGVDDIPILDGRTAPQCYEDFIFNFLDKFDSIMGCVIEEVSIGLGPAGELRYPAHPYADGRRGFPEIGEFQCYDKYMLADLKLAACNVGKPEWGTKGPVDAGSYNGLPYGISFFQHGEKGFLSDYGRFFLEWYSGKLIHHADVILSKATRLLKKYQEDEKRSVLLVAKIGLIYWWYQTLSHPAELTAGYYNTFTRNGYDPLASMLNRHGAALHISCLEMTDREIDPGYYSSPEELLWQLRFTARKESVSLTGRNAYERFDKAGLQQIVANCYHHPYSEVMKSFTFFRLSRDFFKTENWSNFVPFVRSMSAGP